MDATALFTLTYGVFILGTENNGAKNACIINTCTQVASETPKVSVSVLKTNLTEAMIKLAGKFSVSVLGQHASLDQIAHFGMNSGRDKNKFIGVRYEMDTLRSPIIKEGAIATISCRVLTSIDLGSHTLFIGEVVEAEKVSTDMPMTYAYYRDLKAGKIQQGVTGEEKPEVVVANNEMQYECAVCHYIYDGETPFESLPDDYVCPVCGKPKSVFHLA